MNKIFLLLFTTECAPFWSANILIGFKIYCDCKICSCSKCGLLNSVSHFFCGLFFMNSVHIRGRWWNTLTLYLHWGKSPKETERPFACSFRLILSFVLWYLGNLSHSEVQLCVTQGNFKEVCAEVTTGIKAMAKAMASTCPQSLVAGYVFWSQES